MATLINHCGACGMYSAVTYKHEYGVIALCPTCLAERHVSNIDRALGNTNATNLDQFYVCAFAGVDFETGEIVDRARYDAMYRDSAHYALPYLFI